jgi:hypothetical protein
VLEIGIGTRRQRNANPPALSQPPVSRRIGGLLPVAVAVVVGRDDDARREGQRRENQSTQAGGRERGPTRQTRDLHGREGGLDTLADDKDKADGR